MTQPLTGRIAVVTGASAGIGKGIARALIEAGARVYGTGRRMDALAKVFEELGPNFIPVQGDAANKDDLDRLMAQISAEAGTLHVLVANAGLSVAAPLSSITRDQIDIMLNTNIVGTVLIAQAALPLLADDASILLMSSTMAFRGFPDVSVYSATKSGIRALARGWLVELKERRIRVNVITPGPIETDGMWEMFPDEEAARGFIEGLRQTVPLGRLGTPGDVGNLAVFLASDSGSFINGADIQIDGGTSQI